MGLFGEVFLNMTTSRIPCCREDTREELDRLDVIMQELLASFC